MTDREGAGRLCVLNEYVEMLLEFADQQQDHVLAAKIEDVRDRLNAGQQRRGID
jgi:hypothetical protein